jgi:hypothetical protein
MVPDDYYQVQPQTTDMENLQRGGAKFAAEIGFGRAVALHPPLLDYSSSLAKLNIILPRKLRTNLR